MSDALLLLAFSAGSVAAFNPCGFALLPAYLSVLVVGPDPAAVAGRGGGVARALRFGVGMSLGFVAVFGAAGLLIAPAVVAFERYLPAVTLAIGVALVLAGAWALSGRRLGVSVPLLGAAPGRSLVSQVGYGVTFALASLSCTLAPFLAVTTAAIAVASVTGALAAFAAYALGMGAVVTLLALAAVLFRGSLATSRLRGLTRHTGRIAGALLVVTGAYVTWYGVVEVRVLGGDVTPDPVVTAVTRVQSRVSAAMAELPATWLITLAFILPLLLTVGARVSRRSRS